MQETRIKKLYEAWSGAVLMARRRRSRHSKSVLFNTHPFSGRIYRSYDDSFIRTYYTALDHYVFYSVYMTIFTSDTGTIDIDVEPSTRARFRA